MCLFSEQKLKRVGELTVYNSLLIHVNLCQLKNESFTQNGKSNVSTGS